MIRVTLRLSNGGGQLDEVSTKLYGSEYASLPDVVDQVARSWMIADGDTITVRVEGVPS